MRRLLVLFMLIVLAPFAFAGDENITVNADDNDATMYSAAQSNTCSDASTFCYQDVDEDVTSPDNNVVTTTTNNDFSVYDFESPSFNPNTGAPFQFFEVIMSKCTEATPGVEDAGGGDPLYAVALYCNDTFQFNIATNVTVTGLDQSDRHGFAYPGSGCAADGSDVQIGLTLTRAGGGGNRRYPCIEAIEWEVSWEATGRRRAVVVTPGAE